MKLRQNVARLKHFSNRFTDSITRTTHRPSRTILIIDNWARNLYFITHTQFGSHSGKKCLRFGGKKKRKKEGIIYDFPNFLSNIFPYTSLPCCPESKWVLCLCLYGHCQNQGKKMMKVTMKTKTSVCPCVEVMLSCLCAPLYSLFALNDQRRSIRDQCVTGVRHNSKTTGHTLNSVHMYVIYAVHVCISKVKKM